jgi:hypothetical protein
MIVFAKTLYIYHVMHKTICVQHYFIARQLLWFTYKYISLTFTSLITVWYQSDE